MTQFEDLDVALCSAEKGEVPYALVKAQKESKETGRVIYVYENMGLFVMSHIYHEDRRYVAKVYPGGRILLRGGDYAQEGYR